MKRTWAYRILRLLARQVGRLANGLSRRIHGLGAWSYSPEAIAENGRKYGTIACRVGRHRLEVPVRNEFGPNFPTYAVDVVHTLLPIREGELVVDIGGGNRPLARADIVVDLFPEDSPHRSEPLALGPGQRFVQADVQDLRGVFADKEVDFLFTSQTLEHVEDPAAACREIMRVARRGFIDVPRASTELHVGHPEHKWLIDRIDGELIFRRKPAVNTGSPVFGLYPLFAFWNDRDVAFLLEFHYRNVACVQFVWEDAFAFRVTEWADVTPGP